MSQSSLILKTLVGQLNQEIAPELNEDEYFELFCSEQVLKDYDLSYDEIENGNVGKGSDGGIDGFYIFVNEVLINPEEGLPRFKGNMNIEIHVIQSKNQNSFGEDVIQKFISSAEDIFNLEKDLPSLSKVYNEKLLTHVDCFRNLYLNNLSKVPSVTIKYYYASMGNEIHPNVERKKDSLELCIKGFFSTANYTFEFVTATRLFELSKKKQKESYTIKLKENPITTDDGGYICIARLDEYFKFISDDNKQIQKYLFDANVRDYQGQVIVNKEISNTLENEQEFEFWWLNNGITIIADDASVSSKILSTINPQVVNGCQTSYEIYSYFTKNNVQEDPRSLTIRVIKTDDEKIKSKVIKSTNSQTSIPPAVLSATDPIHRSIEEFFLHNGLYYDRRKNYWKNEKKPKRDIVSISTLAQSFKAIILQEPHISRGKPSTLIKNDDDYKQIFNEEYELKTYLNVMLIQRKIEEEAREFEFLDKGDWLNIRYFVYLHFVFKQRENKKEQIPSISTYIDEFNTIDFDFNSIRESAQIVHSIYKDKGGTDSVAKARYFTEAVIESLLKSDINVLKS